MLNWLKCAKLDKPAFVFDKSVTKSMDTLCQGAPPPSLPPQITPQPPPSFPGFYEIQQNASKSIIRHVKDLLHDSGIVIHSTCLAWLSNAAGCVFGTGALHCQQVGAMSNCMLTAPMICSKCLGLLFLRQSVPQWVKHCESACIQALLLCLSSSQQV